MWRCRFCASSSAGLHEEHVRVMTIGRTDELPKKTRDAFAKAWEKTKDNDGMTRPP